MLGPWGDEEKEEPGVEECGVELGHEHHVTPTDAASIVRERQHNNVELVPQLQNIESEVKTWARQSKTWLALSCCPAQEAVDAAIPLGRHSRRSAPRGVTAFSQDGDRVGSHEGLVELLLAWGRA